MFYTGKMDEEVLPLCNALNSLPGIETTDSCCGHSCSNFKIFFKVKGRMDGLFLLTRCIDKRYWKYGYLWKIELSVGDRGELPICFELHSGPIVGEDAYEQVKSLLDNITFHLNHKSFIKRFNLNINKGFWNKEK